MTEPKAASDSLTRAVRRYQRRSTFGTLLVTLALAISILSFLLYSLTLIRERTAQLDKLQDSLRATSGQLETVKSQLVEAEANLKATSSQLDAAKAQIAEATNFVKHVHPLNWGDVKMMASTYDRAARLLEVIEQLAQGNVHFSMKNTPTDGFNSPGLAAYVLSRAAGANVDLSTLSQRSGQPHPGDLVRYATGYTMFYFRDVAPGRQVEFVVGMTPIGISALDFDFGPKVVGILVTPFSEARP